MFANEKQRVVKNDSTPDQDLSHAKMSSVSGTSVLRFLMDFVSLATNWKATDGNTEMKNVVCPNEEVMISTAIP